MQSRGAKKARRKRCFIGPGSLRSIPATPVLNLDEVLVLKGLDKHHGRGDDIGVGGCTAPIEYEPLDRAFIRAGENVVGLKTHGVAFLLAILNLAS